jgi:hypothetical protein
LTTFNNEGENQCSLILGYLYALQERGECLKHIAAARFWLESKSSESVSKTNEGTRAVMESSVFFLLKCIETPEKW